MAAAPPNTANADAHACDEGVGLPPCGSAMATNTPIISGVIHGGWKGILRGKAVVDGNHFDLCQIGDGNPFDQRSGVRVEATAVQVDEYAIAVGFRSGERGNNIGTQAGDCGFFDVDGIKLSGFGGILCPPNVGAPAAFGQRFGTGFVRASKGGTFAPRD